MADYCPACTRCTWSIDITLPDHIRRHPCGSAHERCAACSAARANQLEVLA